jgi:hypothetical protein
VLHLREKGEEGEEKKGGKRERERERERGAGRGKEVREEGDKRKIGKGEEREGKTKRDRKGVLLISGMLCDEKRRCYVALSRYK